MTQPAHSGLRRTFLAAVILSGLLALGLAACGGSGDGRSIPLPPGGVAIGNLVCVNTTVVPDTNMVAQGQSLLMTFHLVDVNTAVPGANLPISFDVTGGSVANPPTHTDANGFASVTYTAGPTYHGNGRVRLIQPDAQLDCDISFTVFGPACVLTSETRNGLDVTVKPSDACGTTEANVERQDTRKILYTVMRPNPLTGVLEPVQGEHLHLVATGMNFFTMDIGPTDANGQVEQTVTPFATGVGTATVTATVIRADETGPNGTPDGIPDNLPCNSCRVSFNIINPICDAVQLAGTPPTVTYRDSTGTPKAAPGTPLRPGESAEIVAMYVVDGTPLSSYPVLVDANDGFINGSQVPLHLLTQPDGSVTVIYTARDGFSGNDTVTFQSDRGDVSCTQLATVQVVTCDWIVEFNPPPPLSPRSGMDSTVTVTLLNADPATAVGKIVALDVTGGFFTQQPPYYPLDANLQVTTTLHVTPGFVGPAQICMSFPGGYPCPTVCKPFVVFP